MTKELDPKQRALRKQFKLLIRSEYESQAKAVGVYYKDVVSFIAYFQKRYEEATGTECRGVNFSDSKFQSYQCNRLGCPACWHRHYVPVRRTLFHMPECPAVVRVLAPIPHAEFSPKVFRQLNSQKGLKMLAYAVYPTEDLGTLSASIIYRNLEPKSEASSIQISRLPAGDIKYAESASETLVDAVQTWSKSLYQPYLLNDYEGFLSLRISVSSWLRIGRLSKNTDFTDEK